MTPKDQERERLTRYRSLFNSEDGQYVLNDLQKKFLFYNFNGRVHAASGNSDGVIWIDAQRELILTILDCLTCNIEERLQAYEEGQAKKEEDPLHVGQSQSNTESNWNPLGDS